MTCRSNAVGALVVILAAALAGAGNGGTSETAVRAGGVNTAPSMRPWRYHGANPDGWWCRGAGCAGVPNGTTFVDRELPLVAGLGVQTLRLEFPWALIQPRRGSFDWRRADYIVRRAARLGVTLQPVVVYAPAWAASAENRPPSAQAFARFMRALASRYRGRIRHYELWNEPDLQRYWDGTVKAYVERIVRPGYRAVKSADQRARVILGGPSKPHKAWFDDIYRYGGGRSFDIAAYHDYASAEAVLADARIVRDALVAHGQPRKPIWLGEYGFPEAGPATPSQEAMIRGVLTAPGAPAAAQWYSLRDTLTATCCPPETIDSSAWGLVTKTYERKSSYLLMQQLLKRS